MKLIVIFVLLLAVTIAGKFFLNAPMAHIQFAAEPIVRNAFGFWNITNSMLAAWLAMFVLIVLGLAATRKMQIVPRGLQNLMEAVMGWLLGLVESIAGPVKGRKFFPLIATIFLFILFANWMALIPVFGMIGKVETAEEFVAHHMEAAAKELNAALPAGAEHYAEHYEAGHPPPHAVSEHVLHDSGNTKLVIFDGAGEGLKTIPVGYKKVKEIKLSEYWDFEHWEPRHGTVDSGGNPVNLDGKTVGLLVPYLRSMNTDLMNPLAFGIIAMVMIEFWGIQANGLLGYGSRFINFKGGPIGFFVGILETISEFARLISFTFRLLGNMFAGEVVLFAFIFLTPLLVVIVPLGLETFVGFIQAVIFAALTLLMATLATESHEGHKEEHEGAAAAHH